MINLKITYARHNPVAPATVLHPSVLSFYDLTLVLSGTITYAIGGKEVVLQSGDAILIPPGTTRARTAAPIAPQKPSASFPA